MEYKDETIAELKKNLHHQQYTDIKGAGVFIDDEFMRFSERQIYDGIELYIPEAFIEMPEELKLMKFPSVRRPQMIYTSLDGHVNFAFNLIEEQTPDNQVESLAAQMEAVIRKSNPAAVFYQEVSENLPSGRPICMFDFKNYSIDEQLYNMFCFTTLSVGTLHGTFVCLDRDAVHWKNIAWEAFKTIGEKNKMY